MAASGNPVLVTDSDTGQNRAALAAVRALAAGGYRPYVATTSGHSLAAASRHCAGVATVPPVSDPAYATAVAGAAAQLGAGLVLPASDAALTALGAAGRGLIDKSRLAAAAGRAGLELPPQEVFADRGELERAARRLIYPVVVKPTVRDGWTHLQATRVDGPAALSALPRSAGPLVVQRWVGEPMRAVAGVVRGGRLAAVVHQRYVRTWPTPAGTACAALTGPADLAVEARLPALLEGFDGIFQAQFIGPYLIDVNPRVYGSLPLAVAAGANLAALECALGEGATPGLLRAREGVRYRWIEGDVRHVLGAVASGALGPRDALGALRPRRGTAHSVESLSDPRPALRRLRFALRGG